MKKVIVTGANGFLGSHIVRRLSRLGFEVISVVRKNSDTKYLKRYQTKIINYDQLETHMRDVEYFVQNAGVAKDWGKYSEFEAGNVKFLDSIYELIGKYKVKHVVHVSSIAAIGEENCIKPKNENAPYLPTCPYPLESMIPSAMNFYRQTKALGEQKAIEYAKRFQFNLSVFRPAWIYGPREFNAGPYEYCKTLLDNIPVMPGSKTNLFHVVYVEDVARAVGMALEQNHQGIDKYIIGSNQVLPMHDFYKLFADILGKRMPTYIPYILLIVPVMLLEFFYLLFRVKSAPLLTRARLYMLYANNVYDVEHAKQKLGFVADADYVKMVRKTIKWWKINKHL